MCSVDCAGEVTATWLTTDHKPNLIKEKVRILACGGSVVYLHGHKPYLRGGDFFQRHSLGHKPKQLNYSRAFGGKGLKKYGLIVDPDVQSVAVTSESRFVILGSDGLWDCLDPQLACELVLGSRGAKRCAAEDLVDRAIERMPNCGVVDNVSAIVLSVNELNHD
jgi:protein phosphatase